MYRGEPWIIRAYSGFGEPHACNERYKKLVEWGVDEIVMAVDLPTQVGYDSDHIMARGEVGKVGVAIDTLRDMEVLFEGIPLNRLKRVSMLGNSFGPVALVPFYCPGGEAGIETIRFCGRSAERYPEGVCGKRDLHLSHPSLGEGDDGCGWILRETCPALVSFDPLLQSHQRRRGRIDEGRCLCPCQRDLLHQPSSRPGIYRSTRLLLSFRCSWMNDRTFLWRSAISGPPAGSGQRS